MQFLTQNFSQQTLSTNQKSRPLCLRNRVLFLPSKEQLYSTLTSLKVALKAWIIPAAVCHLGRQSRETGSWAECLPNAGFSRHRKEFHFSRAHGAGGGQRAMLLCFPRFPASHSVASEYTQESVLLPGRMQEGLSLSQLNSQDAAGGRKSLVWFYWWPAEACV